MDLNLKVSTRILFGDPAYIKTEEISEILRELAIEADTQLTQSIKLPLRIPTPANLRFNRAKKKFDDLVYALIQQRKKLIAAGERIPDDILQILLNPEESDGFKLSDQQIRDELTTLFMAGYETTSYTLGWLFYRLAKHPEIAASVKSEAVAIDPNWALTVSDLSGLIHTTNLIKETLRFYPSVWLMVRRNNVADALQQYCLPANSTLLLNVYGVHHDINFWQQPEEFCPARFTDYDGHNEHSFAYLPFGKGPRQCIGEPLAMMLMQITTIRLVSNFEFTLSEDFEVGINPQITLKPKPGIFLKLVPWSATS